MANTPKKKAAPKKPEVKINPLYGTASIIKGVGDVYAKAVRPAQNSVKSKPKKK